VKTLRINSFLLVLIAGVWLVQAGCSNTERVPQGVLCKEEMANVLSEIYIVEEKLNQASISRDSGRQVFEKMKGKVFEKAGVSDSVFKKSLDYYMANPTEMELIYTALVDSLNLDEQRESVRVKTE